MRRVIPFVFCAFIFISLSACDSGETGEVNNEFALSIESASSSSTSADVESVQGEINGFSFFVDGENPETGEKAFGVYLNDAKSFSSQTATQGLFGFVARSSSRPESGTYSFTSGEGGIANTEFVGFLYEDFTNFQNAPFYVVKSGTLTIEESSSDKVSGTIDATGTQFTYTGSTYEEQTVQITGEFTAKDIDTFVPFGTPGV